MFWTALTHTGINVDADWQTNRHIILCNQVSLVISAFTLVLFLVSLLYFGWIIAVQLALVSALVFLFPILLNRLRLLHAARLFLIAAINFGAIIVSVADKFDVPGRLEEFQYFHIRIIILGASLFPFILFRLEERAYWIIGVVINLLAIVLFDPAHILFGVGYYQMGFSSPHYYFMNHMCFAIALVLTGSSYFLKNSYETVERKNQRLINNLNEANTTIALQKEMLTRENIQLNLSLMEKNTQLTQTNEELIHHNNELHQFSYTVSHNLRGPVASLLGLIRLLEKESLSDTNREIVNYILNAIHSLDTTIKDLNSIIDIRNRITRVREEVNLSNELDQVMGLLQKEMDDQQITLQRDFSLQPAVVSVKPMISSILYNLVSNAIKYRSPERPLVISVKSRVSGAYTQLSVSDNGLGLDVEKFRDKLFGLYKRFHTHTDGKGIGLFLVKLQAEALGGHVDVSSEPDKGTTFTVSIRSAAALPDPAGKWEIMPSLN